MMDKEKDTPGIFQLGLVTHLMVVINFFNNLFFSEMLTNCKRF